MSLYNPQYKNEQGNIVDLPINAKKLDGYSYNDYSKYYTTSSTTENAFLVTIPYVKALSDGLVIHCKFNASTKSGATLNVNNLGAKGIYYGSTTAITTQIVANNYVELVYSSEIDKWVMSSSYDETTNKCVKYSEAQNLTDAQKKQARDNISAVSTNKDETISGLKTFAAPTNKSGTEQATVWFNTANGGRVGFGKEGPNSGTGIFFDQVSGTRRLKFRASATPGAMVWEQPESGSCLYYDVNGVQFRGCNSIVFNKFNSAGYLYTDSNGSLKKGTLSKVATSGSYNDLSNKPTIPTETTVSNWGFTKNLGTVTKVNSISPDSSGNVEIDIPKTISTQDIRITDLQDGTYVLTYSGKIRLYWNGAESDDYVEHLQRWTNTWNPILVVKTTYSSSSGTSWFWQCYNFISLGWNFKGKVTNSGNAYTSWTDCKYFVEYTYPDTQLGSKTKPIYLTPSISGGYSSSEQAYKTAIAMDCDEYAGGTNVTLNGTNKSATTASFYAPTSSGTSGQFLKSSGSGAPTWTNLSTVATSGSYNDLTNKPSISNATITIKQTGHNDQTFTLNGNATTISLEDTTYSSKTASSGGTEVSLVTTGEKYTWNNKQDKISVGTNGQLLSSNGSSLVWTNDNRGLLHHDLNVEIANTTTDSGWSMFNSTYNGYLLKSVRFNANSPDWGVGNFGSGIVFGGSDTKGVMSVAYGTPDIKFAGGNGSGPKWWIKLTGTSGTTYDLDELNNKQNKISALGTETKPVYFSSDGVVSACLNYGGGTKVTLNGTEYKGTNATLYAPTTAGTSGYSLKSNGSGAPRWANEAKVQVSGTISSGAKNNASVTFVITNTSKPLRKGVWRYSGTHGVFLVFAPTEITTMGSPRTAYICGYVSSSISNNTSLTLVEV